MTARRQQQGRKRRSDSAWNRYYSQVQLKGEKRGARVDGFHFRSAFQERAKTIAFVQVRHNGDGTVKVDKDVKGDAGEVCRKEARNQT